MPTLKRALLTSRNCSHLSKEIISSMRCCLFIGSLATGSYALPKDAVPESGSADGVSRDGLQIHSSTWARWADGRMDLSRRDEVS